MRAVHRRWFQIGRTFFLDIEQTITPVEAPHEKLEEDGFQKEALTGLGENPLAA